MRSAPSVEDCIIQNVFFLGISDAVFLSHRLNPLNTTGVNSRCCLSCTCAHIRACAYERSHLLLFTVRRAPLCQSVQNTHGCQIGIRSLLVRFHGIVVPGLLHNSLWSCRPIAQRKRDRLSPGTLDLIHVRTRQLSNRFIKQQFS